MNNNAGMSSGGKMLVYDKTALAATAVTAGDQFASYFGGKSDRLRYDSPSMAGFVASASIAGGNFWDAGLTYGASYGDVQVAASAQLRHTGAVTGSEQAGASIALKHASGLSAGFHAGKEYGVGSESTTAVEGESWGLEAGYTTSAMSNLGATSFNVVYTEADETITDLYEAEVVSFHLKQQMPAGIDVIASYEVASFDDGAAGTSLDDVSVFLLGTRLSF
jgi:hypothetical protein